MTKTWFSEIEPKKKPMIYISDRQLQQGTSSTCRPLGFITPYSDIKLVCQVALAIFFMGDKPLLIVKTAENVSISFKKHVLVSYIYLRSTLARTLQRFFTVFN